MDATYLDELDYCLTLPPAKTKTVPVRDRDGWHLHYEEVPADWPYRAIVLRCRNEMPAA